MKLNRTGSNWTELERNKINENWDIIEGSYNDVVGQITDEVVGHLIDSARLDWKEPVDTVEDLPASAEVGETRMVREADPDGISYVYRYDGENWEKIQAIDVTLVNEVDRRLSSNLNEVDLRLSSNLSDIAINIKDFGIIPGEVDVDSLSSILSAENVQSVLFPSGTYVLNKPMTVILKSDAFWWTTGNVKIVYTGELNENVISINANTYDFTLDGRFEIDAGNNARMGLNIVNNIENQNDYSNCYIKGLTVRDVLLKTYGSSAKGIEIRGGFNEAILEKITIKNIDRIQGTGVVGSGGSHGIVLTHYGKDAYIKRGVIDRCLIDTVKNQEEYDMPEDVDCDGIVMITPVVDGNVLESWFEVKNSVFRDNKGRAIKSQTFFTEIDEVTFYRRDLKAIRNAVEVDFQFGGGTLSNFKCFYNDNKFGESPLSSSFKVVSINDSGRSVDEIPPTIIERCKAFLNSSSNIPYFITTSLTSGINTSELSVKNIATYGKSGVNQFISGWMEKLNSLKIEDAYFQKLNSSLVNNRSSLKFNRELIINNVRKLNSNQEPIFEGSGTPLINAKNVSGFLSDLSSSTTSYEFSSDIIRTSKLQAKNSRASGVFAIESIVLSEGQEHTFSVRGVDRGKAMYFLTSSFNDRANAIFTSNGSSVLSSIGVTDSSLVSFGIDEPNKVCVFETGDGIKIKNNFSSSRYFTLASIG